MNLMENISLSDKCLFYLLGIHCRRSMVILSIFTTGSNLSRRLWPTPLSKQKSGRGGSSRRCLRKGSKQTNMKARVKRLYKHGFAGQWQSYRSQGWFGCQAKDALIVFREWHLGYEPIKFFFFCCCHCFTPLIAEAKKGSFFFSLMYGILCLPESIFLSYLIMFIKV